MYTHRSLLILKDYFKKISEQPVSVVPNDTPQNAVINIGVLSLFTIGENMLVY